MKKKTILSLAFLAQAIVSGWNLLACIAAWLIGDVLGGISFPVNRAATIGIIGGADGPTSVFVTASTAPPGNPSSGWISLLLAFTDSVISGNRNKSDFGNITIAPTLLINIPENLKGGA